MTVLAHPNLLTLQRPANLDEGAGAQKEIRMVLFNVQTMKFIFLCKNKRSMSPSTVKWLVLDTKEENLL